MVAANVPSESVKLLILRQQPVPRCAGKLCGSGAAPGEQQSVPLCWSEGCMGALSLGEGRAAEGAPPAPRAAGETPKFPPSSSPEGQLSSHGCSAYPSCSPKSSSKHPQRHNCLGCRQHPSPWLCTPLPQCHFKGLGLHLIPVPKSPSRPRGRRPSPRCWSLHCHAGNPNRQENPPNPLGAITPQALHRHNTHLEIYMIHGVKCLSDNSLGPAALAISSVKYLQNPKVLREKSSYFD